ncbi:hypothetical protein H4S01_003090 [Coemansia sp. RSA 2610]|nr:hypothetical protein H4S01_003090 [Coemansia sp. RSA 2610]
MVSPNIRQALPCTHCGEQLSMPLDAQFTCPANLQRQFAVMRPFNIERFLAHQGHELRSAWMQLDDKTGARMPEILVGFMDAKILNQDKPDANLLQGMRGMQKRPRAGLFAALERAWAGVGSSIVRSRNLLAVATEESISWYAVHTGLCGSSEPRYERVFEMPLVEARVCAANHGSAARIGISSWQGTVEVDLGSDAVGQMWHRKLTEQGTRALAGSGRVRPIAAPQNPDDGYNAPDSGSHAAVRLIQI